MMQLFRRTLPILMLLLAAAIYASAAMPAQDAPPEYVYVGTQGNRIEGLRLDPASGELTATAPANVDIRPTWLLTHPSLPVLYAVDDRSDRPGSVSAFNVNRETGELRRLDTVATQGVGTTHLTFDAASNTLLAANYNSGSVSSIAVHEDGSLGETASTIIESGSGPNRRQMSAHAHSAVVDPSGRYVLVPDLGADRVFVYRFDRATHALSKDDANPSRAFVAPFGSGPRHIVFGADGRFAYLITELSADVMVLRWDASQGRLRLVQSLPVSSAGYTGAKSGAEIAVSRDGRFVYAADRGANEIVVYRVDVASGALSEIQRASSNGVKPWGFGIDPSGKWLLIANQASGTVTVLGVDPLSGLLKSTRNSAPVRNAVSIAFVR
ncbi:3-carboxymuconate cyclase-like protein [Caballeronia pedi]|uniref:3-carboxymuconate cyclase-like protein n=1 Tax=Caballeronia pedi TaxID=1777141 RepID=A0A158DNE2_9BURK|nr:lactonase family protein [Caballeronia pedi]SAK96118.1 3-carboxymuconate cyclase-like protein [Caballeronia pedi]